MLQQFDDSAHEQVEVFLIFYSRIFDEENLQLLLNSLPEEQTKTLLHRCTPCNTTVCTHTV